MRKNIILILLGLSSYSYCQISVSKPLKLIVLKPDTAIIDKSLYGERDSIVNEHSILYYQCLKIKGDSGKSNQDIFIGPKNQLFPEIPQLLSQDPHLLNFKYYHLISEYSSQIYDFYFNELGFKSTTIELPNQNINLKTLKYLSDSAQANYIIFFDNLHTIKNDGSFLFKLTTSLYSKKENKVVFKKATVGDTINRGHNANDENVMWNCNSKVKLSCLMINGVRTSSVGIVNIIKEEQLRQ